MTRFNQGLGWRDHAGIKTDGLHVGHGVVIGQPHERTLWIGQILFAKDLQAWLALNELRQHGVGA